MDPPWQYALDACAYTRPFSLMTGNISEPPVAGATGFSAVGLGKTSAGDGG